MPVENPNVPRTGVAHTLLRPPHIWHVIPAPVHQPQDSAYSDEVLAMLIVLELCSAAAPVIS